MCTQAGKKFAVDPLRADGRAVYLGYTEPCQLLGEVDYLQRTGTI